MNKDIDALAPILRQLGGDLDGQRTKADALGVAQKALGGGMLSAADAALTEAERVDKLSGALSGVVDAQATYDQSLRNVDAAGVALTDSQTALNKLTKDGAKDQQAISDATDQYQSALRGVRDATDRQTEAQKALSDAQKPATVLEMASATDKLQAAQDSLTDSQKSLADATAQYEKILTAFQTGKKLDPATFDELAIAQDDARQAYIAWQTALGTGKSVGDVARAHKAYTDSVAKLQTLQKQGTVTEADVQTAKEKVDTATVTLDGSTQSLADSQTALTAAQQKGSDLDPAVVAARKNLRDATEGLDSAQKNATQSQKTMSTAMKGDPAWAENVRKARADVADKTAALHKAQTDAAKSAAELETKTAAERTTFHDLGGEIANVGAQLDQLGAAHPEIASFLTPLYAELGKALENLPKGSVIGFTPLPPGISGPGTPILKAASGAIVMPRPGGTLVNVAEAGQAEGIFPLPAGMSGVGGGTTTINYVTVEGSVWSLNDLTDALHEGLLRKQRRSGSLGLS
jgi:chromosome segregation ATPase